MECEMCGKSIATRRYLVSGSAMNLGSCCSKYGEEIGGQSPQGSAASRQAGLERRAQRNTTKSVYDGDRLDLVDDFGARVAQARQRKNIAYEMLGTKVHATVQQLHKIERNELRPSDKLGKALERELGITLYEALDAGPAQVGGVKKAGKAGLTIGDLLKDAMKKD